MWDVENCGIGSDGPEATVERVKVHLKEEGYSHNTQIFTAYQRGTGVLTEKEEMALMNEGVWCQSLPTRKKEIADHQLMHMMRTYKRSHMLTDKHVLVIVTDDGDFAKEIGEAKAEQIHIVLYARNNPKLLNTYPNRRYNWDQDILNHVGGTRSYSRGSSRSGSPVTPTSRGPTPSPPSSRPGTPIPRPRSPPQPCPSYKGSIWERLQALLDTEGEMCSATLCAQYNNHYGEPLVPKGTKMKDVLRGPDFDRVGILEYRQGPKGVPDLWIMPAKKTKKNAPPTVCPHFQKNEHCVDHAMGRCRFVHPF